MRMRYSPLGSNGRTGLAFESSETLFAMTLLSVVRKRFRTGSRCVCVSWRIQRSSMLTRINSFRSQTWKQQLDNLAKHQIIMITANRRRCVDNLLSCEINKAALVQTRIGQVRLMLLPYQRISISTGSSATRPRRLDTQETPISSCTQGKKKK